MIGLAGLTRSPIGCSTHCPPSTLPQANEVENDAIQIKGFPTIMFFPNGKKDAPITFDGARDVNSMITFIKEHSTKPFEVELEPEAAPEAEAEVKDEL